MIVYGINRLRKSKSKPAKSVDVVKDIMNMKQKGLPIEISGGKK